MAGKSPDECGYQTLGLAAPQRRPREHRGRDLTPVGRTYPDIDVTSRFEPPPDGRVRVYDVATLGPQIEQRRSNHLMRITRLAALFALVLTAGLRAQNPPAPAAITPRLDTPQARVIVATLQPRTPSIAANGHINPPTESPWN